MKKGFCPRTNPHPSGVPHPLTHSKKKMEQEYHKEHQRRMDDHLSDGCVAPPPPYDISPRSASLMLRDTSPHSISGLLRVQSLSGTAGSASSSTWSVLQCPNCHQRLPSSSLSPNAIGYGRDDWDGHLPPPVCESTPFQELREITMQRPEDEKFGLKIDKIGKGVYITTVVRGSPAAKVGLKVGDEVIRVNGYPIARFSLPDLMDAMRFCETALTLVYRPRSVVAKTRHIVLHKDSKIGLRLQRRADGIFIDMVVPSSPADEAGLKEGDEVLKINHHFTRNMETEQATELLKSCPPNSDIDFWIREIFPTAHVDGFKRDEYLGRSGMDCHGEGTNELKPCDVQSLSAFSGV